MGLVGRSCAQLLVMADVISAVYSLSVSLCMSPGGSTQVSAGVIAPLRIGTTGAVIGTCWGRLPNGEGQFSCDSTSPPTRFRLRHLKDGMRETGNRGHWPYLASPDRRRIWDTALTGPICRYSTCCLTRAVKCEPGSQLSPVKSAHVALNSGSGPSGC